MIVIKTIGINLPNLEAQTFMLQSAVSSLAVMPILAHQGSGDVEYATNIVTLSTVLFSCCHTIFDEYNTISYLNENEYFIHNLRRFFLNILFDYVRKESLNIVAFTTAFLTYSKSKFRSTSNY